MTSPESGTGVDRSKREAQSLTDLLFLSRGDIGPGGVFAVLLAVASMVVVLVALAGQTRIAAVLLAVLLVVLGLFTVPLGNATGVHPTLGMHSDTRLLALISVGIIGLHQASIDGFGWLTLVLLAGVIIGETALRRLHTYTVNAVANLPGQPQHRVDRLPTQLMSAVSVLAIALAAASAVFGSTWLPALVVTLVVGTVAILDLFGRINRLRFDRRNRKRLTKAVQAYAPTFAVHWRADPGTDYQISMWLPFLQRLGKPFIVIVRTPENFAEALALTDVPVLLRRNMVDLDDIVVPSLKTVFYVNNATANSQMVRYPGLRHIMLNHGDSDKAPSYNPVSRMYDKNFVAGQAAIDRFTSHGVEISPSQFAIVGRPQIEDVAKASGPIGEVSRPRVLYAPTWAGFTADAAYSSLAVGPLLVKALLDRGCDVVFRPHPYAYRSPALTAACTEIAALLHADASPEAKHAYGEQAEKLWSLSECFNNSDAMISDVSGVVADYLYSNKPLAMCAVHASAADFVTEFPLAEVAYLLEVTKTGITDLDATLDQLLKSDPLAEPRHKLRTYYLGDPGDRPYADLFFDEAAKYV
ncbi:MAG: CDP-glycerol glycerophosphotransferase family protein [Actinobacteria bacterium]|nr:CDP-glycerol glycerophosphotransferase family protein [Actinomycetota bacterium]MBU4206101.1 CDP-glycerol glycerophosphotransferase family protein [Actinomycetota bacterium]MBU4249944.1 CDP-glycerol glycerophosphotransferase family protein [Actinomycetota bacterium]MBU4416930.1 CDP-glycerol glycerophosphotransferase family protein [Actinomycetota bacterium]